MSLNLRITLAWLRLLATCHLVLGRREAAVECFDRMLECDGRNIHALASRAHLRAQLGDREAALRDYAVLTGLPAARAADFFNQGFLQEAAGLLPAAEESFRRAIALDEQLDRAWYGLGLVLIGQSRFDEAITALRRNTQLQPMSPYAWCELARIHARRQQPDEAARIIRHLNGFEPRFAAQLARETGIRIESGSA